MVVTQRAIVDALEEELRVANKPKKIRVLESVPQGSGILKVRIDSEAPYSRGLDESLEGSAAWWPGPPRGSADVLSVSPENDQINLRYLTGPPPAKGSDLLIYSPRYLEALKDIWESPQFSHRSISWLERVSVTKLPPLSSVSSIPEFSSLRPRQRQAFGLLDRQFGFLWGPPGTGKTYTLGAMLAYFLRKNPRAKVLLLSTTNSAVDLALLSVDDRVEELSKIDSAAGKLRKKLKRIGTHFEARNYVGKEHLLPSTNPELIKAIAALEAQVPDRSNAVRYAVWKDKMAALRAQIPKPLDEARLAAMTTTSAAFAFSNLQARGPFDLAVFDESSQISLPHALAIAPLAKKVLFAGDNRQLAPIVQSDHPDAKRWLGVSMFEFMTSRNRCFLNEQSRMAAEICEVVSNVFYEGELIVASGCERDPGWKAERRVTKLSGIGRKRVHIEKCAEEGSFKSTKYGRGLRYESAEYVSRVAGECASEVGEDEVLVLTPFRAQRSLIRAFLRRAGMRKIRVSTVHRAQGSERHTVIFDPVLTSGEKLLGSKDEGPRLVNVALSRAKARLVLICSEQDLQNETLRRVAQVIKGEGQFEGAIPLAAVISDQAFPSKVLGKVVRWQSAVGPVEQHSSPGFFFINDYVSGQRKSFKTDIIRDRCHKGEQ